MTIRARLTAAVGFTALAVLALSAIALVSASNGRAIIHEPEEHFRALDTVQHLGRTMSQAMQEMHDVGAGRHDNGDLTAAMVAARAAIVELEAGAAGEADPIDHQLAADFRAVFDRLDRGGRDVAALAAAGDDAALARALETLGEETYERDFLAVLDRAIAHEHAALAETVGKGERHADRTRWFALALAAFGGLVTLVAMVIVRRIVHRLTGLTAIVGRMRDGALDARTADVVATDELGDLGQTFNAMAGNLARMVAAEKAALEQELALAARMQQSILPRTMALAGVDIAAVMIAANQIGGDYYDVQAADDGGWIGIGDVSGHGFNAGVVMIMAQSTIAACVRSMPEAGPAEILRVVNQVLYDNVRTRLGLREHMTLSLLRYRCDGRIVYAGAHQELLIRGRDGAVRELVTVGPWLGLVPELKHHVVERELELAPGESLVLFTDGLTEARGRDGAELGLDGLTAAVAGASDADGVAQQCAAIMSAVETGVRGFDDDATLVVIHRPAAATAIAAA